MDLIKELLKYRKKNFNSFADLSFGPIILILVSCIFIVIHFCAILAKPLRYTRQFPNIDRYLKSRELSQFIEKNVD